MLFFVQSRDQFGRARENDLDEPDAVSFETGQQPDLFQDGLAQGLCLVYDEDDLTLSLIFPKQEPSQGFKE